MAVFRSLLCLFFCTGTMVESIEFVKFTERSKLDLFLAAIIRMDERNLKTWPVVTNIRVEGSLFAMCNSKSKDGIPPPDDQPKPKPILRHRPKPKSVRFLAETINLETGSLTPVNTRAAKPSHRARAQTRDSISSTERLVNKTREESRSRSHPPFKRASSPYPGKSVSTHPRREHHEQPASRPVAQAPTSRHRVPVQSPGLAHKSHREPEAALPQRPRQRSTSRARLKSPHLSRVRPTIAIPPAAAPKKSTARHQTTTTGTRKSRSRAPRSRSRSRQEVLTQTPAPISSYRNSPDDHQTRGRSQPENLVPVPATPANPAQRQRKFTSRSQSRQRAQTPTSTSHGREKNI
ncbi:hypothetical protein BKA64DRAFT_774020 [Cadophora sp. MPI-SDFR-AT-0126]|nr:hypothetical protein BKA64DRAFT_774020 [Leotiomycetes sp. MPI-SDFR-AT-0126]